MDFEWILHGSGENACGLRLPPDGIEDPVVLEYLRGLTKELHADGCMETLTENVASERVLERNDFERTGTRTDAKEGEVTTWRRAIA